jgi:hypothetical protein
MNDSPQEVAMPPKFLVSTLLAALTLMPLGGCVVRVPGTVGAPAPRVYATSWVEQLKLQITPPTPGPRVAAAGSHSWHRVRLQVGRVDNAMPVLSRTLDPFEDSLGDFAAEGFAPGEGYWIRVALVHVGTGGVEWEVGSGMLGGQGQSVKFQPGPNAVPIPILPTVTGTQLDVSPTPLRRAARSRTSASGVITIGTGGSSGTVVVDDSDDTIDIEPILDWLGDSGSDDGGWDDSESDDEGDSGSDAPEVDEDDMGDFAGTGAAYQVLRTPTR